MFKFKALEEDPLVNLKRLATPRGRVSYVLLRTFLHRPQMCARGARKDFLSLPCWKADKQPQKAKCPSLGIWGPLFEACTPLGPSAFLLRRILLGDL